MTSPIRTTLLAFAALLPLVRVAAAQDVVTGTPPFGTFQSFGPTVLNVGNLNSQVTIPVFSRPGRGGGFHYSFVYDNSLWKREFSGTAWSWQPRPQFGWHGISEGITGYLAYKVTDVASCVGPPPKPPGLLRIRSNFVYHDSRGVSHAFAGRTVEDIHDSCDYSESITNQFATDGSGYILNSDPEGTGITNVRFADGTVINPPHNDPNGDGTVMDPNGNIISTTVAGGVRTFTDTLGTAALTVSGSAPAPVLLKYRDSNGVERTVRLEYETRTVKTNFGCPVGEDPIAEFEEAGRPLLTRIVFPDQSSYSFTYEATPGDAASVTGRIASVTLPTGATISYTYTGGNNGIVCDDASNAGVDITTSDGGTWQFARTRSGAWVTTATDPAGNQTATTFSGIYRTQVKSYAGDASGTPLTSTVICYTSGSTCEPGPVVPPIGHRKVVTTLDNGQKSVTSTTFDTAGMPTNITEYEFSTGAQGPTRRQTEITYASLGDHVWSRPSTVRVWDMQTVTRLAETRFTYDDTPLIATSGLPQHAPVTTPRGNLTTRSEWLGVGNSEGSLLTTTFQYDDAGMRRSMTDPGGHVTSYSYTDDWNGTSCLPSAGTGAFATEATNALSQRTARQFHPCTGLAQSLRDPNDLAEGRTGTNFTYDLMSRSATVTHPDGGVVSFTYADPNHVTMTRTIDGARSATMQTELDGYGRTSRVGRSKEQGTLLDVEDLCYDSMGRPSFRSYPYEAADLQSAKVCAGAGEAYSYDALGRLSTVTQGDGSTVQYAYTGRATRITESGNGTYARTRILQSDALGALRAVCELTSVAAVDAEAPAACGLDIAGTGFRTTYSYDALGRLKDMMQGRLNTRSFRYDSLGRMTSESAPEAGSTTTYLYDDDGLRQQRVRPAPNQANTNVKVTTTYAYDELHRLKSRSYDDGVTPAASFSYDEAPAGSATLGNAIGRLTQASTSAAASAQERRGYDPMGRLADSFQKTPGLPPDWFFRLEYGYDLAGGLTSATNGVGVRFDYAYDDALRLSELTSSWSDLNHPATLLSDVSYGPFGRTGGTIAGRLTESATYTAEGRLQSYAVTKAFVAPTVSVTPDSVTLGPSQQRQFTGTCTRSGSPCPQTVRWTATQGSITQNGLYRAPAVVPSQAVATITACWAFVPEVCDSAQAILTPTDDPPVARIERVTCSGRVCTFDGTTSSDDHGIASWFWNFGDGNTGAGQVAFHTYAANGLRTIHLTVTDTAGQTNTATHTQLIFDEAPTARFTKSCSGRDCIFDGRTSSDDVNITSYSWSFGDGTFGSGPVRSHTYAVDGTYSVRLTVADTAGQTSFTQQNVTVSDPPPVASFTVTCTGRACTFDGQGSTDLLGITSWSWSFGDGATGSEPVISHTYLASGTFTAQLTVTDTAGQTDSTSRTVPIDLPPAPAFTVSCTGRSCDVDASASSDDLGIASYSWNFGDGSAPGSTVTANQLYAADNTYTITLTVTDNGGQARQAAQAVPVADLLPTASFEVGCSDRTCTAESEASSDDVGIVNYTWTWGDGQSTTGGSPASAPSHTYVSYGSYTINLTVRDVAGQTAMASRTVFLSAGPTAAFTFACLGRSCDFDASASSSAVAITSYRWSWGDETTSDGAAATAHHDFASDGTFAVSLQVTDAAGRTGTISHAVSAVDHPPTAALSVVCIDRTCHVDSEGSSDDFGIVNYAWTWGDGQTTAGGGAVSASDHTYASYGIYTIGLTVTDAAGQTASASRVVTLSAGPTAAFTVTCTDRTCSVDASGSSGAIASYHWDWDDETSTDAAVPAASHTFPWDGIFRIHLRVTDTAGRFADVTHEVEVALPPSGPTAAFDVTCTDRTCNVDASASSGTIASYHWDWGDEMTTDATVATASHTFAWDGTFNIHLRVTDSAGRFADVTHPATVTAPPSGPTAAFAVSCTGRTCSVDASGSSGTIASYHWDWDDETSTDATVPTARHTFAFDDTFSIHLRVTDGLGRFADVSHSVTVPPAPAPTAAFTVTCTNRSCTADASASTGVITSYHWEWGDASTTDATVPTASHTFPSDGTFDIHLTVTDGSGATASVTHRVSVVLVTRASFTVTCAGRTCNVDASGATGTIASYHWDWDDETSTDATVPAASHTYAWDDTFRIHLRVTDTAGGFADVTHPVTVQAPPSGPTAAFDVACTGRTCTVDASGSTGTIDSYHWDWDDETATDASVATASHTFAWDGTFNIHLRVTDSAGRFADVTHPATVTAPPSGPTAAFAVSCTGRTCSMDASGSSGTIASYHWDWDDETSTDATVPVASHTYSSDGTFAIHLRVTDTMGLFGDVTQGVTVALPPSGPTAAFTAACTNRTCTVDASSSTGTIASYHWDWDDETSTDATVPPASHTFASDGTFNVHLRVTDTGGRFADATLAVSVQLAPSAPTAAFTVTCTNRTCNVDASASSGAIATYHWNWGDEMTTDATVPTASHTFPHDGAFSIRLTVTDTNGATAAVTRVVTVQLPPSGPTASFTWACIGRNCSFNASASSGSAAITNYHWDWDDETTKETAAPTASHRFPYKATFQVHLAVTDANGNVGHVTRSVTVR